MDLNKEQVFRKMSEEDVVILNVLPKDEFKKLHIKGSESFPLTKDPTDFSRDVIQKYGKDKNFIVYCERFGLLDSYMASRALLDDGVNVENYSGGLREWHRAGLPVEGTEALGARS